MLAFQNSELTVRRDLVANRGSLFRKLRLAGCNHLMRAIRASAAAGARSLAPEMK